MGGVGQPTAELPTVRHEKGVVEETRRIAGCPGSVALGCQAEERAAGNTERFAALARFDRLQAHDSLVPGRNNGQILDDQMCVVDMRRHGKGVFGRGIRHVCLLGRRNRSRSAGPVSLKLLPGIWAGSSVHGSPSVV
ncbi:hypothetical protein D9M70_537150 [compost metagenome]